MSKTKDWFIIRRKSSTEKDEFYAIEDRHGGIEPKVLGGEVVGICSFKEPTDAVEYIKFVLTGG